MANNDENFLMKSSNKSRSWNFGNISRASAEQLLINEELGTFLIRDSEHFPGNLTLSIKDDDKIQHYRIKYDLVGRGYTVDDESFFPDLRLLVEHYELDADGLCCRLEKALNNRQDTIDSIKPQRTIPLQIVPTIDYQELQLGKMIGSGEFSEVHEGFYRKSRVAIKIVKGGNALKVSAREVTIMNSLKHRNLVQLLGYAQSSDDVSYLVTEFMTKGSLLHYLTTRGRTIISQKDLLSFVIDTCEGLVYLEKEGVVHRDIAASNVLIADDSTAKISDFGLAIFIEETKKENGVNTEKMKCRTKWTAPEALESKRYTHKSDVWSCGILLWEVFSYGRSPYPRLPADEVLNTLNEGYRMDPPDNCPKEIVEIMRQTWQADPDRRPSFDQIRDRLKSFYASF